MTITQFIEKAIEGGWKLPHQNLESEKIHRIEIKWSFWMGLKRVIGRKEPFGWRDVAIVSFRDSDYYLPIAEIILDPFTWQAVGKVERWGECPICGPVMSSKGICLSCRDTPLSFDWKENMHRMIDALASGQSIEDYLATL